MMVYFKLSTAIQNTMLTQQIRLREGLLLWRFDTVRSQVISGKSLDYNVVSLSKCLVHLGFKGISLWAKGAVGPYIEGQLGFSQILTVQFWGVLDLTFLSEKDDYIFHGKRS